jgi:hypothetical protein
MLAGFLGRSIFLFLLANLVLLLSTRSTNIIPVVVLQPLSLGLGRDLQSYLAVAIVFRLNSVQSTFVPKLPATCCS